MHLNQPCAGSVCNDVIAAIRKPAVHVQSFTEKCGTVRVLRGYLQCRFANEISQEVHQRTVHQSSSGLKYELYSKNSIDVLKYQLQETPSTGFISKTLDGGVYCLPMNEIIGQRACAAAEENIKKINELDVSWNTHSTDGEQ